MNWVYPTSKTGDPVGNEAHGRAWAALEDRPSQCAAGEGGPCRSRLWTILFPRINSEVDAEGRLWVPPESSVPFLPTLGSRGGKFSFEATERATFVFTTNKNTEWAPVVRWGREQPRAVFRGSPTRLSLEGGSLLPFPVFIFRPSQVARGAVRTPNLQRGGQLRPSPQGFLPVDTCVFLDGVGGAGVLAQPREGEPQTGKGFLEVGCRRRGGALFLTFDLFFQLDFFPGLFLGPAAFVVPRPGPRPLTSSAGAPPAAGSGCDRAEGPSGALWVLRPGAANREADDPSEKSRHCPALRPGPCLFPGACRAPHGSLTPGSGSAVPHIKGEPRTPSGRSGAAMWGTLGYRPRRVLPPVLAYSGDRATPVPGSRPRPHVPCPPPRLLRTKSGSFSSKSWNPLSAS
ncbi:uncharacterized protein LOC108292731 [Cebus imitator]|uniref:uncharacterized protein LOC108292731 n=1 Tax=Cebus imitator TaxID=2715852 RepID=UPI000809CFFE|nr:uncharacterized protein LOC108292731 [Cebus imitator]